MLRLFIGWPLPSDIRTSIGSVADAMRGASPAASWTRPETYHLTFAFLGNHHEEVIDGLSRSLSEHAGGAPAAAVRLSGPGFFPSPRRPRVAWLGLEPEELVARVAESVRAAVRAEAIAFDEKPFHPHFTIARVKSRWARRDVERFLGAWESLRGTPLLVDSVTLFESKLGPGGAKHIERARIELT